MTLLAAFALLTTGVELIKGRCWSLSIYGLDWLWTVVWELWESGPDVGAFEPKLPVVTSQASICFFLASGDVFTCAHVCVCAKRERALEDSASYRRTGHANDIRQGRCGQRVVIAPGGQGGLQHRLGDQVGAFSYPKEVIDEQKHQRFGLKHSFG